MIFPDMRTVFAFDAFARNTWTDDFRQSVVVYGVKIECGFDFGSHTRWSTARPRTSQS